MKAVHLRVERPCVTRRVSACLRPKTKRGETSSVRWPRNTYWASRTSSERAGTREASRSWQCNHQGRSAGKQSIPWSWTRTRQSLGGQTWTKAYKAKRQERWGECVKHLQRTWTDQRQGKSLKGITLNTMVKTNTNRSSIPELLRQCAQEGGGHLWHPNKIHSEKSVDFLKMASTATKVWFGRSKRATLFKGTCFKILLLIFACFLETASQNCVGRWRGGMSGSVN